MSIVTGLFFLVLLLNQRWSPPLRLQTSHCSTFRIMSDVPSIAVFCNESIECFPGTASKCFLKLLVTIPVAPGIIGIIVHFRFHIPCISIHKLLYFTFFSASFFTTFLSAGIIIIIIIIIIWVMYIIYLSEKHFSEQGVKDNIVLKWTFKKWIRKVHAAFILFGLQTSGGILWKRK